jgi:TonB family protein
MPGAGNRARTRRIWIAAAGSVFAHTLLISGAAGPGAQRPAKTAHQTLSVTLAPVSIPREEPGNAAAAKAEFSTQESDSPRIVERPKTAPQRTESKPAARSPRAVSVSSAHARVEQNAREQPVPPKPGDGITHAPDTTYYTIRQLDIYPVPAEPLWLDGVTHAAPRDARAVVELHISESGRVDAAKIIEAHPRGDFENELRATFLAIRFTPAVRDGRAVRSRVLVRIE